jgi:predicted glycosyltransferase
MKAKRVWIDLDNTPHVPLFAPIIRELQREGLSVVVTVRDAYQTREVADLFGLSYISVGRHYGKHKALKVAGTLYRAWQLTRELRQTGAQLALSHGSRSQMVAARLLGIPSLALDDYEFSGRPLLAPSWIMAPAVIPKAAFGPLSGRVLSYDGIKEDVYVPSFLPDASLVQRLGIKASDITVLLRPPATEAHYHSPYSDSLFRAVIAYLGTAPGVKVILAPRNGRQAADIRKDWPKLVSSGSVLLLDHAENGLNLIWHADLVISGGGTMNREAAAMGVPVYSIFRGELGAVDRHLADEGRLVLVEHPEDIQSRIRLVKRARRSGPVSDERPALQQILNVVRRLVDASDGPE